MRFNSEPTTTERCKVKYSIYIRNEPRTFSNVQVLLNNVAMTFEFFDNFLQLFKCTSGTLKSDGPPQQNALMINS